MEQMMLQMMVCLLANKERMEARMNLYLEEMKPNKDMHHREVDANLKKLREGIKGNHAKTEARQEKMEALL
jgi:hypothetical protein